jgi:hypothetical protein
MDLPSSENGKADLSIWQPVPQRQEDFFVNAENRQLLNLWCYARLL